MLADHLADEDPGVRWASIHALGYVGDERAVEALRRCASDHPECREQTDEATDRIRPRPRG